jgi:hypothetical protein
MGNLLFWLGVGASQKAAESEKAEATDRQHQFVGAVVGILLALVIGGALLVMMLASNQ